MTAAGEDILVWTKAAISRVEEVAQHATSATWRSHDTHLDHGGHTATILAGEGNDTELLAWLPTMSHEPWDETRNAWRNADHIALNDPASVLRRCAADRKILDLHRPDRIGDCIVCAHEEQDEEDSEGHVAWFRSAMTYPCPTALAVAEGYGWTEGEL